MRLPSIVVVFAVIGACFTICSVEILTFSTYLNYLHDQNGREQHFIVVNAFEEEKEELNEAIFRLRSDVQNLQQQMQEVHTTNNIRAKSAAVVPSHVRSIIPIHIIEQTGGAFSALMSLAKIVHNLGDRLILPNLTDKATDKTVFRGYAGPSIKPYDYYFNTDILQSDECLSSEFQFRSVESHHELSPKIDAMLITVFEDEHRPWFKPDDNGVMINGKCKQKFQECQKEKKCDWKFTWHLDIDLSYWDIPDDTTIICMTNKLDQYDRTLEDVLQSPQLGDDVENIAILNWMGVDCGKGSPRVCTPTPTPEDQWNLRSGCLDTSQEMEDLAKSALSSFGISEVNEGETTRAVSFRTEFLSYYKASKPCIEEYLDELKQIAKSWDGKWLRFVDYKEGASQTYEEYLKGYEWLPDMIESFWDDLGVSYIDFDCDGLDGIECALRDTIILAETDEVDFWGGGGGFVGNIKILRTNRGKDKMITVSFDPSQCTDIK